MPYSSFCYTKINFSSPSNPCGCFTARTIEPSLKTTLDADSLDETMGKVMIKQDLRSAKFQREKLYPELRALFHDYADSLRTIKEVRFNV